MERWGGFSKFYLYRDYPFVLRVTHAKCNEALNKIITGVNGYPSVFILLYGLFHNNYSDSLNLTSTAAPLALLLLPSDVDAVLFT